MKRTIIGDRYELSEFPLGRGGMGEVYSGYDQRLDRRVAVKLIRFPFGEHDEELVRRFVHESRVMARLEHPGTPAIYDAEVYSDPQTGPRPFIVMQYVEGIAVDDLIAEVGSLPVGWAAAIAAQVAAVLFAAHQRGIFHRDLKPSNLMLCADGSVKVLDMGLAMFHDPDVSKLTRTGAVLGTPSYMSPEQVRGATVGPQSDLYSLGLVVCEMLTGARVYDGDVDYAILERQVHEPAPGVQSRRPDVPTELDHLLLTLLAKKAEDRPADAGEVQARLLRFATDLGPLLGVVTAEPSALRMYAKAVTRIDPVIPTGPPVVPTGDAELFPEPDSDFGRADIQRAREEAEALARESRYGQAVEVLEAVVKPAAQAFGPRDDEMLGLRMHLAEVLFEAGEYRRAAPAFGGLHRDLAVRIGPCDERVFRCRRQEATCQALMGETGTARRLLRSLLADELSTFGPDDDRPLELRRQIGLLELGAGDAEQARSTLSGVLDDFARLYGPQHPKTARIRENLSRLSM